MENYRDTPLARFSTFWWGLGLLFIALAAVIALRFVSTDEVTDLEQGAIDTRLAKRAEVDAAQNAAFEVGVVEEGKTVRLLPADVLPALQDSFLAAPAAVKIPEQAVPGTATFEKLQKQQSQPAAE